MLIDSAFVPLLPLGNPNSLFLELNESKERPRDLLAESPLILISTGFALAMFIWLGGNEFIAINFRNPSLAATLPIIAKFVWLMLLTQITEIVLLVFYPPKPVFRIAWIQLRSNEAGK